MDLTESKPGPSAPAIGSGGKFAATSIGQRNRAEPRDATASGLDPGDPLVLGTAGLFEILTALCGGSPRQAADSAGFDLRSMTERADLPSLDFVRRLGQPLGMEAAGALGAIVAFEAAVSENDSASPDLPRLVPELLAAIGRADLLDDATMLERLAARMLEVARTPAESRVAFAAMSRAAVARGDVALSARFAETALSLESSGADARDIASNRVALALLAAAAGERNLGVPWDASGKVETSAIPEVPSTRSTNGPAAHSRDSDHEILRLRRARAHEGARAIPNTLGAFGSPTRVVHGIERAIAAFEDLLNEMVEHDIPAQPAACEPHATAIAWTASIAGVAAARAIVVLRSGTRAGLGAAERRAARLLGRAQLALDEVHDACAAVDAASPLRTLVAVRRARLALVEWSMRLAAGELTEGAVDDLDLAEIRAACVPFPLARRSAVLARAEVLATARFWTDCTNVEREGLTAPPRLMQ